MTSSLPVALTVLWSASIAGHIHNLSANDTIPAFGNYGLGMAGDSATTQTQTKRAHTHTVTSLFPLDNLSKKARFEKEGKP